MLFFTKRFHGSRLWFFRNRWPQPGLAVTLSRDCRGYRFRVSAAMALACIPACAGASDFGARRAQLVDVQP